MIYLDNAASSWPKPERVENKTVEWIKKNGANPGRSNHSMATRAGRIIRETRQLTADFLGVSDPGDIVFTLNATHGLNIAIQGLLENGDHVVTNSLEHNSVLRPLHELSTRNVITFDCVEPNERGLLTASDVVSYIKPNTRLVTLTHASNVLGYVQPVETIINAVREQKENVFILLDAAQTAGVTKIPTSETGPDCVVFSGHKGLFGLQGTGVLYVKKDIPVRSLTTGGTGSQSQLPEHPEEMPDRLEAGTPNTPGSVALKAGIEFVREQEIDQIRAHKSKVIHMLRDHLKSLEDVTVYPNPVDKHSLQTGVLSFNLKGVDPVETAYYYNERFDIAVRAGMHCAPWAHRWMGTLNRDPSGAVRVSPGWFNTGEDIEQFNDATEDLISTLVTSRAR